MAIYETFAYMSNVCSIFFKENDNQQFHMGIICFLESF